LWILRGEDEGRIMMSPRLRELLKRTILNPGEAVEITGEEEKELLELTAFLEQHPQITPSNGAVN